MYHGDNLKTPETQTIEEAPAIPGKPLQLQDHNQDNYELYPPLGNGASNDGADLQQPPKYDNPADFKGPAHYDSPAPPDHGQNYNYPVDFKNAYQPAKYVVPSVEVQQHNYLPPALPPPAFIHGHRSPDLQIEISDQDITGFEAGGYSQHTRHFPGLHVMAMQGPLKIPILGPHTTGFYKRAGFPPNHVNGIGGVGKLRPTYEISQSIGYGIRDRRDGPRIHRV